MTQTGRALMGIGTASGTDRAIVAAEQAITCPLLEQSDISGAKGVIISISGGRDMTMFEVNQAAEVIRQAADENANIIFGAAVTDDEGGEIHVTAIATGFNVGRSGVCPPSVKFGCQETLVLEESDLLETPAFMRQRRDKVSVASPLARHTEAQYDDTDLDVPTFLRRRKNPNV